MSDRPPLAQIAADLLREERVEVQRPSAESRARAIAALGAAIQAQARTRKRARILWGAVAVAAAVASVAAVPLLRHAPKTATEMAVRVVAHPQGNASLAHDGNVSPLVDGANVASGDRVSTAADAHASLALSTGTTIDLDHASEIAVLQLSREQIFTTKSGAARFEVAKLHPEERFLVRTDDTEVEVRGTVFQVSVAKDACEGTHTRVDVTEGLVVVRHAGQEAHVAANQHWPVGCETVATAKPAEALPVGGGKPAAEAAPVPMHVMKASAPKSAPAQLSPTSPKTPVYDAPVDTTPAPQAAPPESTAAQAVAPTPASELSAQNDLFAEALAKKRSGDHAGAIAGFDRFLARYPASALAESAAIERMRLLSGTAARSAAKSYLARWPNGSARTEAQAIADAP